MVLTIIMHRQPLCGDKIVMLLLYINFILVSSNDIMCRPHV